MKNQYVGDIGDFGKYSMLRAFIDAGIKVGVNWYLTEDDGSNDGKFTDYLNKGVMRRYCPEVFDALKSIAKNKDKSVFETRFVKVYFSHKFISIKSMKQLIHSPKIK